MEKSLPNPIALAPSYNIRNMACAGRAGKKKAGDTNPDWVEAAADEQIKHSIFMTEIKTR